MKIKSKIVFFVALMFLFGCITLIQDTYAKYVTSASANADITIARWNIKVNNMDITESSDFSSKISPTFTGTTFIKEGKIAPTANGYFDIVVDGNNADVAFQYTINVDKAVTNSVTDLKILSYEVDGVTYTYDETNGIMGNIGINDSIRTKTYRFNVEWNDNSATEDMDNRDDVVAATSGTAAFQVDMNVIQVIA